MSPSSGPQPPFGGLTCAGAPSRRPGRGCFFDGAVSLIEDALHRDGSDDGWLFPRYRSGKKCADQAGKLAVAARQRCGWE